jgi:hypothetical protein
LLPCTLLWILQTAAHTIIAVTVLLAIALPCVSCQAHAECKLLLQGYGSNDSSSNSSSSSNTAKIGVAVASMSCNSSDGAPVPVAVNSTYLQQHTTAFSGVQVLSVSECKTYAAAADFWVDPGWVSITALLYFCSSSHHLTLQQPVVRNLKLALPAPGSNFNDTWHQAILAFGSSVNASISGGVFSNNLAGTALVVMQQAVLTVASSTFRRSNSTYGGEQAPAFAACTYALNSHS